MIELDSSRLCVSGRSWSSVGIDSTSSSGNSSAVHRGRSRAGKILTFPGERRSSCDEVSKQEFLELDVQPQEDT